MRIITLLERQQKHQGRVNVYLDGEFAFGLNELDAATLRKGQTLSDAEIAALQAKDQVQRSTEKAIQLLAYRPRSTQEIRQHLTQKGTAPDIVEAALQRLSDQGYLDDEAFARFWIENRTAFKPLGPQALHYELRQKGVAANIIQDLLAELVDVEDAAYRAAHSQLRRLRGQTRHVFTQKLGQFLQRRGFSYAAAAAVIRRLIADLAETDAAYFGTTDETAIYPMSDED